MTESRQGRPPSPAPRNFEYVRSHLLARREIAFLDVREEAPHAEGHPLFAANLPFARLELDAYWKLPRLDVPIVTFDGGEGLAEAAAQRLIAMGYGDVGVFSGGLQAWKDAGGELFIDVNVPSKAFGELMEARCHTPSFSAEEVQAMIERGEDIVILDARRVDEYRTMSIPTATSVPGAELVLRAGHLASDPKTRVIVNCAGRTRSLIGAQSLINANLPNQVAALRNGTIGWLLARQELDYNQDRVCRETPEDAREVAARRAKEVAKRAGVRHVKLSDIAGWDEQEGRTTYFFDVRSFEEYETGHLVGFYPIPGGQLVQETEMYAPTRGARIVLVDDDGVRANMTGSWLAQMAWEVHVLEDIPKEAFSETGTWHGQPIELPDHREIETSELAELREGDDPPTIIDLAKHAEYKKGHIPGAFYLLRSRLEEDCRNLPVTRRYVVTSPEGKLAALAAPDLTKRLDGEVSVLSGGTSAWVAMGQKLEVGENNLASPPIDRYRRPYEGTDAPRKAMQAYLDWEFGLIEQLENDGTHHFKPIPLQE